MKSNQRKTTIELPCQPGTVVPVRDGYGKALLHLGEVNEQVMVLDADLAKSTRSDWFAQKYPDRFIDAGIAEQNMIGVAAGLSLMGKIPFATTYSVFVVGRAFDQVRNTVCYSNLNVKIVGSHSGLSVGPDGGSHQGIEDIALMNVLPNMSVLCPCDANEAFLMTLAAAEMKTPVYIRLAREATEVITGKDYVFTAGKANILRDGSDGLVISHSVIGSEVVRALDILDKKGASLTHINFGTIKPLDRETVSMISDTRKPVIIIEEHLEAGGLTSIIATNCSLARPKKLYSINIGDCFGESGSPQSLYDKYCFSAEKLADRISEIIAGGCQ